MSDGPVDLFTGRSGFEVGAVVDYTETRSGEQQTRPMLVISTRSLGSGTWQVSLRDPDARCKNRRCSELAGTDPDELCPTHRAEHEAEQVEVRQEREAYRAALWETQDPVARAVLGLHVEDEDGLCDVCESGDQWDGYRNEPWPCKTVECVGEALKIGHWPG